MKNWFLGILFLFIGGLAAGCGVMGGEPSNIPSDELYIYEDAQAFMMEHEEMATPSTQFSEFDMVEITYSEENPNKVTVSFNMYTEPNYGVPVTMDITYGDDGWNEAEWEYQ